MAGASECGNEPWGSVKCGEFLDKLRKCWILRNDSVPWSECFEGIASSNVATFMKWFYTWISVSHSTCLAVFRLL